MAGGVRRGVGQGAAQGRRPRRSAPRPRRPRTANGAEPAEIARPRRPATGRAPQPDRPDQTAGAGSSTPSSTFSIRGGPALEPDDPCPASRARRARAVRRTRALVPAAAVPEARAGGVRPLGWSSPGSGPGRWVWPKITCSASGTSPRPPRAMASRPAAAQLGARELGLERAEPEPVERGHGGGDRDPRRAGRGPPGCRPSRWLPDGARQAGRPARGPCCDGALREAGVEAVERREHRLVVVGARAQVAPAPGDTAPSPMRRSTRAAARSGGGRGSGRGWRTRRARSRRPG